MVRKHGVRYPGSGVRGAVSVMVTVVVVACTGSGRISPDTAHLTPEAAVTFSQHIASFLYRECASCHRPGGSAPFSLLSYADAKAWAPLMAAAVESRRMPPWLPEAGYVQFAGEPRLSEQEIALIRRWADGGAPEGDPRRLPQAREFPKGWQLGEPDLVIAFPSYTVPAGGLDIYRNFVAAAPVRETRFVRTVEVRPGDPRVVHHGRMMIDTTNSSRHFDEQDPGTGFDGMDLTSNALNPDGFFIGWTPGKVPGAGDPEMAWRLTPGTDVVLQLHFRPAGEPYTVTPRVGLHLASRSPTRMPVVIMLGTRLIDIPAGKRDYLVVDSFELPVDVEALGVYPHAHFLAKEMQALARLPNGQTRWLLRIDDWDFNWQDEYRYAKPIPLPRGTVIVMRYTYDNSAANLQNPSDPPKRVTFGSSSTDEMADLVLQLLPRDPADAAALRGAVAWKHHAEQVGYLAHRERVLGDSALARGDFDGAIAHYREAVLQRSEPGTHYVLGNALAAKGEIDQAIAQFQQALRLATESGADALADQIRKRLELYRQGKRQ